MPDATLHYGAPLMVDHTPSAAVAAGDVIVTNDTPRIAHLDIAANSLGALAADNGVYAVTADGAIPVDKELFWNATAKKGTLTRGGNKRLGYSVSASAADGDTIYFRLQPGNSKGFTVLSFAVPLANIAGAGDVLTEFTPGFAGRIISVAAAVTTRATTAAKALTLNLEIGTTNVTGGVVALTSANCGTYGAVVAGTAVTGANVFTATDSISIEATAVTAFAEGEIQLLITIETALAG